MRGITDEQLAALNEEPAYLKQSFMKDQTEELQDREMTKTESEGYPTLDSVRCETNSNNNYEKINLLDTISRLIGPETNETQKAIYRVKINKLLDELVP